MAGLYLHVPFCRHRCGYCDFPLVAGAPDELIARYVAALRADLTGVAAGGPRGVAPGAPAEPAAPGNRGVPSAPGQPTPAQWPTFTSVFVGGGTPTLLDADDLGGVLRLAREVLPVAEHAEVTIEANPEGCSEPYLRTLVDAGLTRLSIGAQSFSTRVLDFLDRRHAPELPLAAVAAARAAGVGSVSLDLIYGAPAETDADWSASLEQALAAGTDHVSAYALTLEPNTPYATRVREGAQEAPDEDVQAARMARADARLGEAGLHRYELSNWARPGHESVHNLGYWRGGDYLGVGAGAHGHWQGRRWWSVRPPGRYSDRALEGRPTVGGDELVDAEERRTERLLLGLRTAEGVPRAEVEPIEGSAVSRLERGGLLRQREGRLQLTPQGLALADAVTLELAASAPTLSRPG